MIYLITQRMVWRRPFGFRCALRGFTAHTHLRPHVKDLGAQCQGLSAAGRHSDARVGKQRPVGGIAVSHTFTLMTPQLQEGGREIGGPPESP